MGGPATPRRSRLNGPVRVKKLGADLSRSVILPAIGCSRTPPNRRATPLAQQAIIDAPVFHPLDHSLFRRSVRLTRRTRGRDGFHYRLLGGGDFSWPKNHLKCNSRPSPLSNRRKSASGREWLVAFPIMVFHEQKNYICLFITC